MVSEMKSNFKNALFLLILSAFCLLIMGCASSKESTGTETDRVSNIPWNKPQSWEGGGALGGALGGGR